MIQKINNGFFNVIKRITQILLLFILVLGIIITIVGAMLGISMISIAENSQEINPKNILLSLNENSKIYDKDNNLIESISLDEYREIVKFEDIPKDLINAIIAIEDERFYQHSGIDMIGVARSIIQNINAGDIVEGGSTITQQLVKNVYLTNEVKWERKISEMYLALKVEDQLTKDQIIEAYLNRVYLGQHAYGVEAAAQTYFSKSVKELSLAQSAALAAIAQSPSNYSLFFAYKPSAVPEGSETAGEFNVVGMDFVAVKNDKVLERKNRVLDKMFSQNLITKSQYDEARSEDIMAEVKAGTKTVEDIPSQISNYIKKDAIKKIMESQDLNEEEAKNLLYTGGLNIFTTIDWDVQRKLEETYENFYDLFKKNNGDPKKDIHFDKYDDIVLDNKKLYYKKENLINDNNEIFVPNGYYELIENGDLSITASRLTQSRTGIYIVPFYTLNENDEIVTFRISQIEIPEEYISSTDNGFIISSKYFNQVSDFYEIVDGDLVINNKYYRMDTKGVVQPQSATVILDSKNADIVAMVGNRGNSTDNNFDRATNYPRPTASVIKPLLVYAPSVEAGRTLASPVDDTPMTMINNKPWPQNNYEYFNGIVTTRNALIQSMNAPAVKIFNDEVGIKKAKEYLTLYGIINPNSPESDNYITKEENPNQNDENTGIAIGSLTKGFTVKEIASAYQTLANNGERIESSIISKITDSNGDLYTKNNESIKIFSKETAFLVTDVLKELVNDDYFTGTTNSYGIETAGKTGTSNDRNDFWFGGYNPYYTATTWVGYDDARLEMPGSSNFSAKFFGMYMEKILEDKEEAKFDKPDNIVEKEVSAVDGLLPNRYTSQDPRGTMVIKEYFKYDTVPTEQSKSHVLLSIDRRNNLLAQKNTPKNLVENRVFVNRPIEYNPADFDNTIPRDWSYNAPTKYSNLSWKNVVKTERKSDGTIVETTTKYSGEVIVKTTRPDGVIVIQTTNVNGSVSTQVIRPKVKTQPEIKRETQAETQKETVKETQAETQKETVKETQAETQKETVKETQKEATPASNNN